MAKIELGKEYKTRDGRPVRILCVDRDASNNDTVVGLIDNSQISAWDAEGWFWHDHKEHCYDLIEVPKIRFPQFKRGDAVLVSNNGEHWQLRVFSHSGEYIAFAFTTNTFNPDAQATYGWSYCKAFEPSQENENGED